MVTVEEQFFHYPPVVFEPKILRFKVAGNKVGKSRTKNCEDAFYVTETSIGLADGVSGWGKT